MTGSGSTYEDFSWTEASSNTYNTVNTGQSFSSGPSIPDIVINELDADQSGTDNAEFVELYDGGAGNTDLTGLVLVLFNGAYDTSYQVFDLDGKTTSSDGYFVLCGDAANVPNCDYEVSPNTNLIQNGADAAALYVGDATDFPGYAPVTTDGLIDAIVYDTDDSDDAGLLILLNAGQPQVNERGEGNGTGHSNQRCPNGTGGLRNTDTYIQIEPTPGGGNTCPVLIPDVIINELDADQSGTDNAEFVELYDGGAGNTDLTGLVLVLFNGAYDTSYQVFDLDGKTTSSDGYFVLCGDAANVPNCDYEVSPNTNLIQNGADAAALYVGDATDFPGYAPVTTDGLIDAIVYDTDDSDDAGLLILLNAGQPQVNERGEGNGTGHSNQRCPNGTGGLRNTDTYIQIEPTPGGGNTCTEIPVSDCGLPYTPVYAIQGDGFVSPLENQIVTTEGVVVGDFQDGLSGFHIQDPLGDGDVLTSDGIYVYSSSPDVAVGDLVRVTGTVDEYYDLTEITGGTTIEVCSTGNIVAATPISLPVISFDDLEAYEGMLVTFPQSLYIAEYFNYDRYGEIVVSTTRQFQPTSIFLPDSPDAAALGDLYDLARITVDDGRGSQNPDPAIHPNGSIFDMTNRFRGGDILNNVTGVVDYSFGKYKIQPVLREDGFAADYIVANPRPIAPAGVGGTLKVASFNVLNYFTTLDSRGADTEQEFTRQRDKIFAALAGLDADIVGLIEIENNDAAIMDLVSGLNDVVGTGTYALVDTGVIGPDEIKVAYIYKPAAVSLVGGYAVLDSDEFMDPNNLGEAKNRPALAQTFMDNQTGGIFTVVVNHLKSKGSSCGEGDDHPLAGSCNLTRTLAAYELMDWLAGDPTGSGDEDILIIGDLNAYDMEAPVQALVANGYSDLLDHLGDEGAYSYVYDGRLGYLDHALAFAPSGTQEEIMGATVWHINADEPDILDYNTDYNPEYLYAVDAYRSSDHDPVLIGLEVCDEIAPTIEVTLSHEELWPANHKMVEVTADVFVLDNFDSSPTITLVSVVSSEEDDDGGDGNTEPDIVVIDDFTFELRAERSGSEGDGRIYTITYKVTDACGNETEVSVEVLVPHDQGKGEKDKEKTKEKEQVGEEVTTEEENEEVTEEVPAEDPPAEE